MCYSEFSKKKRTKLAKKDIFHFFEFQRSIYLLRCKSAIATGFISTFGLYVRKWLTRVSFIPSHRIIVWLFKHWLQHKNDHEMK